MLNKVLFYIDFQSYRERGIAISGLAYNAIDFGPVPQILFNLQYQDNGGDGLIQLWESPNNSNVVNISAYDTFNRDWFMTDSTSFSFNFVY